MSAVAVPDLEAPTRDDTGISRVGCDGKTAPELLHRPGPSLLKEFERMVKLTGSRNRAYRMARIVEAYMRVEPEAADGQATAIGIERYLAGLAERGLAPGKITNHRQALSLFCGLLVNRGLLNANPCPYIPPGRPKGTSAQPCPRKPMAPPRPRKPMLPPPPRRRTEPIYPLAPKAVTAVSAQEDAAALLSLEDITASLGGVAAVPDRPCPATPEEANEQQAMAMLAGLTGLAQATGKVKDVCRMVRGVRHFLRYGQITGLEQITAAKVQAYLGELEDAGLPPRTVAMFFGAVRRLCAFLVTYDVLPADPCAELMFQPPPEGADDADVGEALEIAGRRNVWAEVRLALSTGLRREELRHLQWSDIDLDRRYLLVRVIHTHDSRLVPLSRPAVVALRFQRRRSGARLYVFPAREACPGGWRYAEKPQAPGWWHPALRPIKAALPALRELQLDRPGYFAGALYRRALPPALGDTRLGESPPPLQDRADAMPGPQDPCALSVARPRPTGLIVANLAPSPLLVGFADFAGRTVNQKGVRRAVSCIQRFLSADPPVTRPEQITTARLEQHLADIERAGCAPSTIQNVITGISGFCQFLMTRQLLPANPCRGHGLFEAHRPMQSPLIWLDGAEVSQVLEMAKGGDCWPEVCLALSTGLHLSELIALDWAHINFDKRSLSTGDAQIKSRQPREVPLAKSALAALNEQAARTGEFLHVFPARQTWGGHRGYFPRRRAVNWWARAMRPIRQAVPKLSAAGGRCWAAFRHTFAVRAITAGASLTTVSRWLGHSTTDMTLIYARFQPHSEEEIDLAIAAAQWRGSVPILAPRRAAAIHGEADT